MLNIAMVKQQFRRRFDPSSVEEDLGDDPVKASEYGRRNLQYLLKHINDWVADKDKDFEFRTAVYDEIVYAYVRYLTFVLGDIGGIYLNERYDGDQRPSFKTVSKQQQKKALNFLLNELKDLFVAGCTRNTERIPYPYFCGHADGRCNYWMVSCLVVVRWLSVRVRRHQLLILRKNILPI